MPTVFTAVDNMPSPAEPRLVDTFLPLRSARVRADESGRTTTWFSEPRRL